MKHIIVGTAGHIDHGKTALVRALTGIDTDRLEEEKRRGISIDIGFASLRLASGVGPRHAFVSPAEGGTDLELGFVDVPGHERFVKNMVAGIAGIDLVLFVVAADESIKPQTREHFDICRLLGIRHGIVVLTKADLADRELIELVKLEVEEFTRGSFLEGAPIIPVSSRTGEGIERLKSELRRMGEAVQPKDARHHFRMPIDRVFVIKGFGTVVTGTLLSGTVEREAEVEIYPVGLRARVRGIEVHNQPVDRACAGQRTALNLAGVESSELARGMVVAAAGRFRPTQRIDCLVDLLASARPLRHRAPVHFHTGTAEVEAEFYLLGKCPELAPGARAFAQIRLRAPVLALPGDRFIIRQFSPVVTIGGGVVLDNLAEKHRSGEPVDNRLKLLVEGGPCRTLEFLLTEANSGLGLPEIITRTGWLESEVEAAAAEAVRAGLAERISEAPLWLVHRDQFAAAAGRTVAALERFHAENPLVPGPKKEFLRASLFPGAPPAFLEGLLERLKRNGKAAIEGDVVRLCSHQIVLNEEESQAREKILAAFEQAGLTAPGVDDVLGKVPVERSRAQKILQMLLRERLLIRVADGLVFHGSAIESLKGLLARQKAKSERLTVPQFKELTGISRKYAIPLLEFLDREKVTRRSGNERIIL